MTRTAVLIIAVWQPTEVVHFISFCAIFYRLTEFVKIARLLQTNRANKRVNLIK